MVANPNLRKNRAKSTNVFKIFVREIKTRHTLYIMALPALLFIFIFSYIPMYGALMAFQEFDPAKGILGSKWIWFKNFEFFFVSQSAASVTFNTILYNLEIIVSVTALSLLFAVLLNEIKVKALASTYKTIILLPFFLSWVVAQFVLNCLLSSDLGLINNIRTHLGMTAVLWYSEQSYWRFILPLAYIWKQVGYISIIYVAAIAGISTEYYEAAEIDGAGKVRQFFKITLPMLTPVIITLLLLWGGKLFTGGLGDWGAFYNLPGNSGIIAPTTDVIDSFVFKALMNLNDPGMASAVGLYQAVVGFILVLVSNMLIKRHDPESSLF